MRLHLRAGAAVAVLAASSATAQPRPHDTGRAIEDIVVTAQRRAEKLRRVPLSATSFTAKRRDRIGIRTIQDFANHTPGLSYSTSLDRISLRGVGRLTNVIGSDPGVATYNDGFYTASADEASKTPLFVDRVDILRGPQGTLYGRNAIGGAINIISARPTQDFHAEVRTDFDVYAGAIAEGMVEGAIADGLAGRATLQLGPRALAQPYTNETGRADEGGLNRILGELQLQYDAGERTQVWLKYAQAQWDEPFRSTNFVDPYATADVFPAKATVPNAAFGYAVPNPGERDPFRINTNTPSTDTLDHDHTVVVNARTGFGDTDVKYVGGYSTDFYTAISDLDYTSRNLVETSAGSNLGAYTHNPTYVFKYVEDKQNWSNEVTFSNHAHARLNYIAGLYQYHENFYQPITAYVAGAATDDLSRALLHPENPATGAAAAANPDRDFYAGTGTLVTQSYAAFGQADYEIVPRLKLTAGLRYSNDDKTGSETFRLLYWNPTAPEAACGGGCGPYTPALDITTIVSGAGHGSGAVGRRLTGAWNGASGRLALDYVTQAGTLFYASYSHGLKSGGFNLGSYSQMPTVGEENLDAFEIGFKSKPVASLTIDAAGFTYLYSNAQVPLYVSQGGVSVLNFFNVPKSLSKGFEASSVWNATDWLELNALYAFTDAHITQTDRLYEDDNARFEHPVDITGDRLPQTSAHQVTLTSLVDVPVQAGSLYLATSFIYRSSAYYGVFDTGNYRAPGWNQVDLRLTWVSPSRRLTLIAFARNLFDTLGYDGVAANNGSGALGFGRVFSFTPPRTVGIETQYKF